MTHCFIGGGLTGCFDLNHVALNQKASDKGWVGKPHWVTSFSPPCQIKTSVHYSWTQRKLGLPGKMAGCNYYSSGFISIMSLYLYKALVSRHSSAKWSSTLLFLINFSRFHRQVDHANPYVDSIVWYFETNMRKLCQSFWSLSTYGNLVNLFFCDINSKGLGGRIVSLASGLCRSAP